MAHGAPGASNAIRLLDLEGRRGVPVAYGRATTYPGGRAFPEAWRPALDSMLGIRLPPPSRSVSRLSAAKLIADVATKSRVAILELGPPTNLADALRATPRLRKRVTSITLMSGALNVAGNAPGNKADWNFYVDPVSADIVLRSGIPWTLVPLDATNAVPFNEPFFKRLKAESRTAAARFVLEALSRQMGREGPLLLGSVCGGSARRDPSVATLGRRTIRVVRTGAEAGRTVLARNGTPVRVALEGNQARFEELFLAALNAPWKLYLDFRAEPAGAEDGRSRLIALRAAAAELRAWGRAQSAESELAGEHPDGHVLHRLSALLPRSPSGALRAATAAIKDATLAVAACQRALAEQTRGRGASVRVRASWTRATFGPRRLPSRRLVCW